MKLLKYILIAIVFAATTGEAFGQAKVLSGKVTEMFGTTAEPMIGVNVNILNSQNRSLGGKIDKRKNTSYLSNNCKYDVFYNYVKILNLMTLHFRALFALYNIKL